MKAFRLCFLCKLFKLPTIIKLNAYINYDLVNAAKLFIAVYDSCNNSMSNLHYCIIAHGVNVRFYYQAHISIIKRGIEHCLVSGILQSDWWMEEIWTFEKWKIGFWHSTIWKIYRCNANMADQIVDLRKASCMCVYIENWKLLWGWNK